MAVHIVFTRKLRNDAENVVGLGYVSMARKKIDAENAPNATYICAKVVQCF